MSTHEGTPARQAMRTATSALSYKQKHEQANREALVTVGALAVTAAVWAVCGFGLSGFDVEVYHTPLWVAAGTLGTWACAITVSAVLARCFFADFELDDAAPPDAESGAEPKGAEPEPKASHV